MLNTNTCLLDIKLNLLLGAVLLLQNTNQVPSRPPPPPKITHKIKFNLIGIHSVVSEKSLASGEWLGGLFQ